MADSSFLPTNRQGSSLSKMGTNRNYRRLLVRRIPVFGLCCSSQNGHMQWSFGHRSDRVRANFMNSNWLECSGCRPSAVVRPIFFGYDATYDHGGSRWHLSSNTGIYVRGLTPQPDWVAGLLSLTVRSLRCGEDQWVDLRGVSDAGMKSRWIGYAFSHVEYSKVPPQVASVFDKAIDRASCK